MADTLKLRVLIAAELGLVREALSNALREQDDILVVGEVPDGDAALAAVAEAEPDVVVLNIAMPDHDAVKTSCLIKERAPTCAILVLGTTHDHRMLEDGLFCGARGYLSKDSSIAEIVQAVRAVAAGDTLIPPVMLGPLLTDLIERRREHGDALMMLARLSAREREVLALLARGAKTSEIADTLVISTETARTHVQNMLGKLGVHSRLEAASIVIENGLLDRLENGSATAAARAPTNGRER
jgi:DNA-binding NarL/FixJ family response regulator